MEGRLVSRPGTTVYINQKVVKVPGVSAAVGKMTPFMSLLGGYLVFLQKTKKKKKEF